MKIASRSKQSELPEFYQKGSGSSLNKVDVKALSVAVGYIIFSHLDPNAVDNQRETLIVTVLWFTVTTMILYSKNLSSKPCRSIGGKSVIKPPSFLTHKSTKLALQLRLTTYMLLSVLQIVHTSAGSSMSWNSKRLNYSNTRCTELIEKRAKGEVYHTHTTLMSHADVLI